MELHSHTAFSLLMYTTDRYKPKPLYNNAVAVLKVSTAEVEDMSDMLGMYVNTFGYVCK